MARLFAIALIALAFAACGDDADESAGGSSQTSTVDQAQTNADEDAATSTTEAEEGAPTSGSDDEQGSPDKAPSHAEYIERADRICKSAQADIATQSAEYRDLTAQLAQGKIERSKYLARTGDLTEHSGEIAERAVVDLKALALPNSGQDAIEAYLQGATSQSEILTQQGRALREGRTGELAELNRRIAEASQETRSAAQRVGFRVCGGGG